MKKRLTLILKGEYFDAIRDGTKLREYRLITPYWEKRLRDANGDQIVYSEIELCKGYAKKGDASRRLVLPFRGWRTEVITHPHFGDRPVEVFSIDVSGRPKI